MLEDELDVFFEVADRFCVKVGGGNCELTS